MTFRNRSHNLRGILSRKSETRAQQGVSSTQSLPPALSKIIARPIFHGALGAPKHPLHSDPYPGLVAVFRSPCVMSTIRQLKLSGGWEPGNSVRSYKLVKAMGGFGIPSLRERHYRAGTYRSSSCSSTVQVSIWLILESRFFVKGGAISVASGAVSPNRQIGRNVLDWAQNGAMARSD